MPYIIEFKELQSSLYSESEKNEFKKILNIAQVLSQRAYIILFFPSENLIVFDVFLHLP
ncbi:MAG: hypothetical protein QG635_1810 [Bacteroidota bacterium]|nr:hypothetical protein [Bacteroidota bacterium]